jgi:hypothetical protein
MNRSTQKPEIARHLLTVWNPSYADDAMDEHLRVLLEWVCLHRAGEAEAEEVHVWWAKLRRCSLGHLCHISASVIADP